MLEKFRQYFFLEKWGRLTVFLYTSGLISRLGGIENKDGSLKFKKEIIINPKQNFNLKSYNKAENINIIYFDGINEYLSSSDYKELKSRKVKIFYIGKSDLIWKNFKNSNQLYSIYRNEKDFIKNQKKIRSKYPIFFKRFFLLRIFITILNIIKNPYLFFCYSFKKNLVFFGLFKPTNREINNWLKFNNSKKKIKKIFEFSRNNNDLQNKINLIFNFKKRIKNFKNKYNYFYLEFFCMALRFYFLNYIKINYKNIIIYQGYNSNTNFNAYQSFFGKQNIYLDLGTRVGFDIFYPRKDSILCNKKKYIFINFNEKSIFFDLKKLDQYIFNKIQFLKNELLKNSIK